MSEILDLLERVIFDAIHRDARKRLGYADTESTDHAWICATRFTADGRRERARAAAEAVVRQFEVRARCVCHSGSVCGEACARGLHHDGCLQGADCHSLRERII